MQRSENEEQHMLKRPVCVIVAGILLASVLLAATASGCNPVSASQDQELIEVVSLSGPIGPANPGGTAIELTLRNTGAEPVVSLAATLEIATIVGFTFDDVTPSNPLQPDKKASAVHRLIRGGFNNNDTYPLTINATLRNGTGFVYTKLVQIAEPLAEPSLVLS
jgi:hypothetical protein